MKLLLFSLFSYATIITTIILGLAGMLGPAIAGLTLVVVLSAKALNLANAAGLEYLRIRFDEIAKSIDDLQPR
jgi:hypothetical protein